MKLKLSPAKVVWGYGIFTFVAILIAFLVSGSLAIELTALIYLSIGYLMGITLVYLADSYHRSRIR